jgi:hypothetical protein
VNLLNSVSCCDCEAESLEADGIPILRADKIQRLATKDTPVKVGGQQ